MNSYERDQYALTILIPSRNRAENLRDLLDSLERNLTFYQAEKTQIVVSDNSEIGYDFDSLKSYAKLNVLITRPEAPLLTAEENLFFGWRSATGKYIWTLGDDDPINYSEIDNFYKELEEGKSKVYFWNSNLISNSGKLLKKNRIPIKNDSFSITTKEFIQRSGAWYTASGFSTWVISRDLLDPHESVNWFNETNSSIYGHVTFYLKSFGDVDVCVINRPLVFYRINEYDETGDQSNWWNYAKYSGKYFRKPWIIDFPRQIEELIHLGKCEQNYLSGMIEQNHSGDRYSLMYVLIDLFLEQIEIDIGTYGQHIPMDEFNYFLDLIRVQAPTKFPSLWTLVEIQSKLDSGKNVTLQFIRYLRFRRFQADIHIMRYNLFVSKTIQPFNPLEKTMRIFEEELKFVDYGIGREFFYSPKFDVQMKTISPNLKILRMAQYLPYRIRSRTLSLLRKIIGA